MIIALTGFMGCGKSSVGRVLSQKKALPFVDLDEYIERQSGRSIGEIFSSDGEAGFRQLELEYLKELLSSFDGVLSLGGGVVTTPECLSLIKSHTHCIYLRASLDTIAQHLGNDKTERPMLSSYDLRALYEYRQPLYIAAADTIVDVDGLSIDQIVSKISKI